MSSVIRWWRHLPLQKRFLLSLQTLMILALLLLSVLD